MTDTAATPEGTPATEDFAAMLEESLGGNRSLERTVVKGIVIAIENDAALIDVGLKSEGRVSLKEFAPPGPRRNSCHVIRGVGHRLCPIPPAPIQKIRRLC